MIPPDLHLLIDPVVARLAHIVGSTLARPDYSGSAAKSNQLVYDTLHLIKSAIFERVAAVASHTKLPAELWCQIFSLLPQRDRFSVSHVSTSWRSICTTNPTLWMEIDYHASTQKTTCSCQSCSREERNPSCMGCAQRVPRESDNLGLVRTVLARSGQMDLRVDVTLTGNAKFSPIADVLQQASDRITYLHLSADNSAEAVNFLDSFSSLEKLQQLIILTEVEQDDEDEDELPRSLDLPYPALRQLEVEGPYRLYSLPRISALEYARLPLHEISDFARGLGECNNIRFLHYQIGDAELDEAVEPELKTMLQSTLIKIAPAVLVVSDIYESDAAAIIDVVHIPELRDLTLAFRRDSTVYLESFNIFADIAACISLEWTRSGNQRSTMVLAATGTTGVARKIVWEDGQLDLEDDTDLWEKLPSLEMLERVEVDALNWNDESSNAVPDMPQLRELGLRFYDPTELHRAFSKLGARLSRWPLLERVRLGFVGDESLGLREFAEHVVLVVASLKIPAGFTKLRTVEVSGLDLVDDVTPLLTIAQRAVSVIKIMTI